MFLLGLPSMSRQMSRNYYEFIPDDDTEKDVYLQAHGHNFDGRERHVVIHWVNGTLADNPVTQIVQLSGIRGRFVFDSFTRGERQLLLRLADEIEFDKTSVVNGCRVWMRELLLALVREGLISEETFEVIEEEVPLPKRMPEMEEASRSKDS
ncbi:hypothetical protein F5878DRAFT_262395 [Lentinula raphanica]|uniref:Uncharacterized protein n=1 Tax=Lentinula raphanica TaxID=153919 RepID=A0AA38PIH4_9AGAR|nr:hypothetical protein F5878DRAFT_262395 [Lentinula raphanica]